MNHTSERDVALFTEAFQMPAEERHAFLERACTGDSELLERVEALLRAHERSGSFLKESATGSTLRGEHPPLTGTKAGDQIGRYKLLQQIGEGGCGIVYMAEQEEPVRRLVALKVIKPGMDTRSIIARFEAERQALAMMDHPNIAKVFDAGATEAGRPYFVMELVRGIKITNYCDQNSLSTPERLGLFIQVCHAVQHAHQKGIIHRDIKPSNILVTTTAEGQALPRVIDFGIAKATTTQRLTDKTMFTAFEMLIGTPAYMSPEQAALASVDVDTRTDIYSLGVLLYELLTSTPPFDAHELLKSGLDEIRRVIREQEPQRPSSRLGTMTAQDLTIVARCRQAEPPKLIRALAGDLDWIVMKALEKDRTRRYGTATGLAADVERFLAREPVSARPPSTLYRFQKSVLRNKMLYGGISIIAILLVAGFAAVTASLGREREARHKAETEEARSRHVTQFLKKTLEGVGPSVALGRDTIMLKEILDRTAEGIGKEMAGQPAVETELRSLIGRLYFEIGNYDKAEVMHRAALAINRKLSGADSQEAAAALHDLALALCKEDKLAEAESTFGKAIEIRRHLFGGGNAELADSLNSLATVYRHQKRLTESEALTREALGIRRNLFGEDSLEAADTLHNLSVVLGDEGKRAEAEATAREMLEMRRRLVGNNHPLVAAALADVAWAATASGKLEEAEAAGGQALAMRRSLLGDEHPDVARSLSLVGQIVRKRGDVTGSCALLKAALSIQRKVLSGDNMDILYTLRSLGTTLEKEGNQAEAEAAYREMLALWRKRGAHEEPQALETLESLNRVLVAQKKFSEAEQALGEALTPSFVKQRSSANTLMLRADLRGRRGEWKEAAADAVRAFEHQPSENDRWCVLAALLAKTEDLPGYEQLCRGIFKSCAGTSNPFIADPAARACLLVPSAEVDVQLAGSLAERAVTLGAKDGAAIPFFQISKALAEYRLGHFAQAVEWASRTLGSSRVSSHGQACAVMAMAQWRLGEKEAAISTLAKGEALAPRALPKQVAEEPGKKWQTWLLARVLLDEAAKLIEPPSPGSTKPERE